MELRVHALSPSQLETLRRLAGPPPWIISAADVAQLKALDLVRSSDGGYVVSAAGRAALTRARRSAFARLRRGRVA
jgi:hypothetical protein